MAVQKKLDFERSQAGRVAKSKFCTCARLYTSGLSLSRIDRDRKSLQQRDTLV